MPRRTKQESDSLYFLKLLMYFLLGALWVRFSLGENDNVVIGLPVGLIIGLLLAHHERLQIDRKIEFAVLLGAATLSFFLPVGVVI